MKQNQDSFPAGVPDLLDAAKTNKQVPKVMVVQVSNSAGGHKTESSSIMFPRRSLRIEMQQKELQLEKLRIAKRYSRSSLSENQKQEILEKYRKAYEMRRIRVNGTTNEYRAGPSS
ncbi:hypothetical protein MKW92_033211, partial [Papaver armeniacum]